MNNIIEINNVSKKYHVSQRQGYLTLRDIITNVAKAPLNWVRSKQRSAVADGKNDFWALKDVSFNVGQGEVVGVIGRNGAGKSTLLKILSKITPPTNGEIIMRGRVGSLLEVGTGFHPELTGRENVFLNGAIIGMRKKEIEKKFDEIVSFAGIEKFLDMPVKRYSSGMYVRLAFSVAAHLEPEILLVDEVLAVGDSEFQKKCLGKMEEVTSKEGRTILFVSHNMAAIRSLCSRCVLLDKGQVVKIGETKDVIDTYLNSGSFNQAVYEYDEDNKKKVQIKKIKIIDSEEKCNNELDVAKTFKVEVEYEIAETLNEKNCVNLVFYDSNSDVLFAAYDIDTNPNYYEIRDAGRYKSVFQFPADLFNVQTCYLTVNCGVNIKYSVGMDKYFDRKENITIHFINYSNFASGFFSGLRSGNFMFKIPCNINKL